MTRILTALHPRNPRNPWLKEVKKSPRRLGGSKLFPRLRVRSAASRGTGPAANRDFGGSKNTSWRLGGSKRRPGGSKSSSRLRGKSSPGFSLIEMLFAIGILGLGLIMVAATFPVAVKWTAQNAQSTIGQVLAQKALAYIKTQYGVGSPYAPPSPPPTGIIWYGFQPLFTGPANSIYYWTACISPSLAGGPTTGASTSSGTLYDLYIFVFNKGDVNNKYPSGGSTPPTGWNVISVIPFSGSSSSSVPNLVTGKLTGNPANASFPLGSIGVDLFTGQVFRKIVDASGNITMSGLPTGISPPADPVLYAPPALNQASSPLIYVYVTTVSL